MEQEAFLNTSGASQTLGVSEAAPRQWTDEGKIKVFVTPGGHRRYSRIDLKKFMSTHSRMLGVKDLVSEIEETVEPSKREETMHLARQVGQDMGEILATNGLPLADSVEAFLMHREPVVNASTNLLRRRDAFSGRVVDAIPLAIHVIDETLVSLVAAHQQYRNGMNSSKEKQ